MKQKTVAILYGSDNQPKEILQVKTIDLGLVENMEKELKIRKEQQSQALNEFTKKQIESQKQQEAKDYIRAIVVAKGYFDNLVDRGLCETTKDFEDMFDKFMLGGRFDESLCPYEFKKAFERVK